MPFAKGVSAKSHDFHDDGSETKTDYERMLKIVCVKHGWRGHIGIEYEGSTMSEDAGIRATKVLLERMRVQIQRQLSDQLGRRRLRPVAHCLPAPSMGRVGGGSLPRDPGRGAAPLRRPGHASYSARLRADRGSSKTPRSSSHRS